MIPDLGIPDYQRLAELLSTTKKIVVTTHHRPDGDAMGSSLALAGFLKDRGHKVNVITPSDYPDFLYWMPGHMDVLIFESDSEKAIQITSEADLIFCLDFNAPSRIEKYSQPVFSSNATKILVDHHLDPDNAFDLTFSFNRACATCEIIYHLIVKLGGSDSVTADIASCIYTGIMTDTGSFRFGSMTPDTHRIIAHCMEAGAVNHLIHEAVYDNYTLDRTRFLGYCINEKLVVLQEYNTAYIAVTEEELKRFNHKSGDTEGIVNYALGIKGVRMAAFFCERDGMIKISFRSKGDFSVKELAGVHFSGGGHTNAAGGRSGLSLSDTITKFLTLLPSYNEKLNP